MSSTRPKTSDSPTYCDATSYAAVSEELWPDVTEFTVNLLDLQPGMHVRDIACGPGGLTLRAAAAVGLAGSVMAVDANPEMLAIAASRAHAAGLDNVSFLEADLNALAAQHAVYDAVMCGLAIHCAKDPTAFLRSLWRSLRPGGRMVISTYAAQRHFVPHSRVFLTAVRTVRPDIDIGLPWEHTSSRDAMFRTAKAAGLLNLTALTHQVDVPTTTVDDFWQVVTGAGYSHIWNQLRVDERTRVKANVADWIERQRPHRPVLGVHNFVARKPYVTSA